MKIKNNKIKYGYGMLQASHARRAKMENDLKRALVEIPELPAAVKKNF